MNSSFLVSANFVVMSQIVLFYRFFSLADIVFGVCLKTRLFKQILNTNENSQILKSMKFSDEWCIESKYFY